MPSEFVDHYTKGLAFSGSRPVSPGPSPRHDLGLNEATSIAAGSTSHTDRKANLHALLVSLNQNTIAPQDIEQYTRSLQDILRAVYDVANIFATSGEVIAPLDPEEAAMEEAIIGKLSVALYATALDTYLTQATEVEAEAEWWADIEGSRASVALYLLQSMFDMAPIFSPFANRITSTPSAARSCDEISFGGSSGTPTTFKILLSVTLLFALSLSFSFALYSPCRLPHDNALPTSEEPAVSNTRGPSTAIKTLQIFRLYPCRDKVTIISRLGSN
jgi:hypothetical protein